jgi:RNA-directed DNA polymerase
VWAKNRLNGRRTPRPRWVCSRRLTGRLTGLPRTRRAHSRPGSISLDTRHKACQAVPRPRGAAGLDQPSIARCAANLGENRVALMRARQSGTDQPRPRRRVSMPQGPGRLRPCGIPAGRWRVAQAGRRARSAPLGAPTLPDRAQGFRRRRSGHTARAQLVEWPQPGDRVVVEAALPGCFARLPPHLLLALGAGERADGNMWHLITQWLQAGGMDEGAGRPPWQGPPPGGGRAPWVATSVLPSRDGRLEALGATGVR